MDIPSFLSQQRNAGSRALLRHALRPKGGLHFPNMGFSEEKHAQPGLADPPADGLGQFAVQKRSLERKRGPLLASRVGELAAQGVRIHPDPHGRDLEGPVQKQDNRRSDRR